MRSQRSLHRLTGGVAATAAVGLLVAPFIAPSPALAEPIAPAIALNEVIQNHASIADAIELVNLGDTTVDLSGWILADDRNAMPIAPGTSIAPGEYLAITVDDESRADKFGLGRADQANLKLPDGTLVDTFAWTDHATTSYGRCDDGTGEFRVNVEATPNAANACEARPLGNVVINEVESSGGDPGDWVELFNRSDWDIDLSGLTLTDNNPAENAYALPAGITIAAGGFVVLDQADFGFGLGGADAARLLDGDVVVDEYSWATHAAESYGRCPDGVGVFAATTHSTKGSANVCPAPEIPEIVVNEVESSDGNPGDWIELYNLGAAEVDLTGWVVRDSDDAHVSTLPAGSTIPAGGFFVVEEAQLGYGLGKADSARIYLPGGHTLVDTYSWTATVDDEYSPTTFGRCPDGTGDWKITTASTKGAANDCGMALRINEVETSDDWVELVNVGFETLDLSGMKLRDSGADNEAYVFAEGTSLASGEYLRVAVKETFGLGKEDRVDLLAADDSQLDTVSWSAHPVPSFGRCPDGTGPFVNTRLATPGAENACVGDLIVDAWPGAEGTTAVDTANTFGADMSGVVFAADGTLWAVNNGNGTLHKLQLTDGVLTEAEGWIGGRTLRYPDGAGTVDAEGVALIGGSAENGVLVASERNTGGSDRGSRPSVLRYDVSGSGDLVATHEWNLAADYPGIGANAGLEGVAWVADADLVAAGLVDESTDAVYDPAAQPAHSGGVIFVGVEASNRVAGFVLGDGGEIVRISEFETAFPGVMELEYDAATGLLWVLCDDTCEGRTQIFRVGADAERPGVFAPIAVHARPAGTANIANEGMAIAPIAQCVAGQRPVVWADDSETDGHAFRVGSIACTAPDEENGGGSGGENGGGSGNDNGTGGATQPVAPAVSALTAQTQGAVTLPRVVRAGEQVTISVGAGHAGASVDVWMFSTPVHLGGFTVGQAGTVRVTIPAAAAPGTHRIAVTAADGSVLGWEYVTVEAASSAAQGSGLATTGAADTTGLLLGGAAVLLAGGAALALTRRRSQNA